MRVVAADLVTEMAADGREEGRIAAAIRLLLQVVGRLPDAVAEEAQAVEEAAADPTVAGTGAHGQHDVVRDDLAPWSRCRPRRAAR